MKILTCLRMMGVMLGLVGGVMEAQATPADMELQLQVAPASMTSDRLTAWDCVLQRSIGNELILGVSFGLHELGLRNGSRQGAVSAALRLARRLDFGSRDLHPYIGVEGGGATALFDTAGQAGVMAGMNWYPGQSMFGVTLEWSLVSKTTSEGGVWVPSVSTTQTVNGWRLGVTQRY
ncbi:MAG: hypothetical protein AB3X41_11585 [Leptothrix ochracea]|uniref:hypothetical protein n=1 Tax=Leptothrix ochracea TaxID=735331 RepID=UPI0034E2BC3B